MISVLLIGTLPFPRRVGGTFLGLHRLRVEPAKKVTRGVPPRASRDQPPLVDVFGSVLPPSEPPPSGEVLPLPPGELPPPPSEMLLAALGPLLQPADPRPP